MNAIIKSTSPNPPQVERPVAEARRHLAIELLEDGLRGDLTFLAVALEKISHAHLVQIPYVDVCGQCREWITQLDCYEVNHHRFGALSGRVGNTLADYAEVIRSSPELVKADAATRSDVEGDLKGLLSIYVEVYMLRNSLVGMDESDFGTIPFPSLERSETTTNTPG